MNAFRWWLFKQMSWVAWKVCPEPHRSNLQAQTPQWKDIR